MKLFIFDMDGTIIDSMDFWSNLILNYLKEQGLEAEDGLMEALVSLTFIEGVAYVKDRYNLSESVEEIENDLYKMLEYNYRNVFNLEEGTREIFDSIKNHGNKIVLATATQRSLVDIFLERFDFVDYFDLEIVSDEVELHKDNPLYFRNIADKLGVSYESSYVVEDSLYAIESAKKAGMKVASVTFQSPEKHIEQIRALSDFTGEHLLDIKEYLLKNE